MAPFLGIFLLIRKNVIFENVLHRQARSPTLSRWQAETPVPSKIEKLTLLVSNWKRVLQKTHGIYHSVTILQDYKGVQNFFEKTSNLMIRVTLLY